MIRTLLSYINVLLDQLYVRKNDSRKKILRQQENGLYVPPEISAVHTATNSSVHIIHVEIKWFYRKLDDFLDR